MAAVSARNGQETGEIYENERFIPSKGWAPSSDSILPGDPFKWSTWNNSKSSDKVNDVLKKVEEGASREWTSQWKVYKPPSGLFDEDGWTYAGTFPQLVE